MTAAFEPQGPRHLLSLEDIGPDAITEILRLTDRFVEVNERSIPRVPALRGKTIATCFFEDSTRTRMSFETAAKRLSAEVLNFSAGSSSLSKGESLRDTIETIGAMGVDAFVVRHRSSGVPEQISRWVGEGVSVLNGGDGWHSHPTQGLLDAYTLVEHLHGGAGTGHRLDGVRIGIVGDVRHSRVARSDVTAFAAMGAQVTLIAPSTLLPASLEGWPVEVTHDFDAILPDLDVIALLRVQRERLADGLLPTMQDYVEGYGLDARRADLMGQGTVIIHPGPVVRGIEVTSEVLETHPRVLVQRQVANGVAVRMAVLFWLLGSGVDIT